MVLKDFYKILSVKHTGKYIFTFEIHVWPEHAIFKGHFPGFPVVPGACMIQITKELTERMLGHAVFVYRLAQVKFIEAMVPDNKKIWRLDLVINKSNEGFIIENNTYNGQTKCLKMVMYVRNHS